MYSRDTGRGNSREGGSECTVGTQVGATVGRGGGRGFVMTRGARGRRGNTFDLSAIGARPAAHAAPAPHEMLSCKASNH